MKYVNVELNKREGEVFAKNLRQISKRLGHSVKSSHVVRRIVKDFNEQCAEGNQETLIDWLNN